MLNEAAIETTLLFEKQATTLSSPCKQINNIQANPVHHYTAVLGVVYSWMIAAETTPLFEIQDTYCASHVLVQPSFRRYYFLPDQAQTHLDHFNVLDELWCQISFKSDNG